jgi:diguanylate cyclase (GGDEF)-like protein
VLKHPTVAQPPADTGAATVPAPLANSLLLATPAEAAAAARLAWEQCYFDAAVSKAMGHALAETEGAHAAEGWLLVALAEVRAGCAIAGADALANARQRYQAVPDPLGELWCDEVQAIALRRGGDYAASQALHTQIDQRWAANPHWPPSDMLQYVANNSRAISAKLAGDTETALRHFYAASDAAARTGWAGPIVTALSNLGGYMQELFNLEDARRLSEQALAAADQAGISMAMCVSALNLIVIHHVAGEPQRARAMVQFLEDNRHRIPAVAMDRAAQSLALGHLSVGEIDQAWALLQAGAVAPVADGDGKTMWAWLAGRCLLARNDASGARAVGEAALAARSTQELADLPIETMELYRALADACEQLGDPAAALRYLRQAHARYELLVGRSARARYIALEVMHQLGTAQRERDLAVVSHRSAEDDRQRLAKLNDALRMQVAQTEQLHTQLREQALRDPLTGLHNRRYLFEVAPGLLELARRQNTELCVVLIDLDHFKLLNDTFGHQAGDQVLQRFATLATQLLRRSDVVCRHGGEEFVVLMPDIDADGAQTMLTRLLDAFTQPQPVDLPGRRRLPSGSFSAGITRFPRHGHTLEQLLLRADRALYAAKDQGRARIEQVAKTGFGALA